MCTNDAAYFFILLPNIDLVIPKLQLCCTEGGDDYRFKSLYN